MHPVHEVRLSYCRLSLRESTFFCGAKGDYVGNLWKGPFPELLAYGVDRSEPDRTTDPPSATRTH